MLKKKRVSTIEIELEVPNVEVLKIERGEKGEYLIWVKSTEEGTECHKCGCHTKKYHGKDRAVKIRHLPIQGHSCDLMLVPKRYECVKCSKGKGRKVTTTQRVEWFNSSNSLTLGYEEYLLLQLVNSTIADVSIKEGIGYDRIEGVLRNRIKSEVEWSEIEELGIIGIDEIALRKGHKDFVVIVTSKQADGEVILLGVLEDRKKATVVAFFESIPFHLRMANHSICSDICLSYINGAYEVFDNGAIVSCVEENDKDVVLYMSRVVIDRFHVAKNYRECLDDLRKEVMKRLKSKLPAEEYKEFKNIRWLLRRNPDDLKEDELALLDKLFELAPDLKEAYDFCQKLTQIFDTHHDIESGAKALQQWRKLVVDSTLTCFNSFITTLDNHFQEIVNYFDRRLSSGFVEGLNNKIKVIKRRCYGILDTKSLFRRISLDLTGYRRFRPRYNT